MEPIDRDRDRSLSGRKGSIRMEIHLSLGVSTIVALMAAHRAAAGSGGASMAGVDRDAVARTHECSPAGSPTIEPQRAVPHHRSRDSEPRTPREAGHILLGVHPLSVTES
jgi:hypothetical protein